MLQLVTRWETEDAAHLVDQVIQRGINKDGTLVLESPPLPVVTSTRPNTRSVEFFTKWSKQERAKDELVAAKLANPNRLERLQQQLEAQRVQ
jgi:hypothetical protein